MPPVLFNLEPHFATIVCILHLVHIYGFELAFLWAFLHNESNSSRYRTKHLRIHLRLGSAHKLGEPPFPPSWQSLSKSQSCSITWAVKERVRRVCELCPFVSVNLHQNAVNFTYIDCLSNSIKCRVHIFRSNECELSFHLWIVFSVR